MSKRFRLASLATLAVILVRGLPATAQEPPQVHRARASFYVMEETPTDPSVARQYMENLVRRTGVAQVASSRESADFLLAPSVTFDSELTREDHTKSVEEEYYNDKGEKKKRAEQRVTHRDDLLKVTTRLTCVVLRPRPDALPQEIASLAGYVTRSYGGPSAHRHGADDPPIRIRRSRVHDLEQQMIDVRGNSAEGALTRVIVSLCRVQAPVTEVDRQKNRLTVGLGSDDGIQAKDFPSGVTEMDIYARTGRRAAYTYEDPDTSALYVVDKRSSAARPDSPDTWVYVEDEPLPGAGRRTVAGPDTRALVPIGEKVSGWAEVQDLSVDHCRVALKKKGEWGRTVDDTAALNRIPDPQAVPLIARVRGKRG